MQSHPSKVRHVAYSTLRPSSNNVRRRPSGIASLAESIKEYGLLQNLVVIDRGDFLEVVAGNRRLAAIGKLVEAGHWDPDANNIGVLPIDSHESLIQVVENVARSSVPMWQLGARYNELLDQGYTQAEVAQKIGCSAPHVSQACRVARFLAPSVVAKLDKLPPRLVNVYQLMRMAKRFNPRTFEPDESAQLAMLEGFVSKGKTWAPRGLVSEKNRVYQRYRQIKKGLRIPSHALPYVEAIMGYLDGTVNSLRFL